ncbi:MAG: hypothetical protein MJY99_05035 [Fibrobacter sp.]|nr:hypothetical protein [Fibrobacter sp.]
MFRRFIALTAVLLAPVFSFAQDDDWGDDPVADSTQFQDPENAETKTVSAVVEATSPVEAPVFGREVPVRYWVVGEPAEQEAIFVKIEKDTVFLKRPNEAEQKKLDEIADEANAALQESNGQEVEEAEDEEVEIKKDTAEIIMTDAVKDAVAAQSDSALNAGENTPAEDTGADDDFETALKKVEIAKVEEEIRQREIQDSIAADSANPYIKVFRLNLKRLVNLEDNSMIDLSLSDYVVPLIVEQESDMELYPPGNANLLVVSNPEACSVFVNGIPLKQVAPDTIKSIRPGKYTISVMKVLKDVEWWGSAVVKINADSLNKVEIPVLRPSTRLTLNTNPEAVEVFVDEVPTENVMPHYMTDVVVDGLKPQAKASIYMRKVGYRDTTIVTEIKAFMPNFVFVELTPVLDDLEFIEQQKAFNAERSQRRLGRGLLWGSIAPFIAGGVLWYLAERDWSDAADKKKAYKLSAFESEDTKQMVKDNHDLNKSGDIKGGIAAGLGAIGLGLLTVGIIFAF